MLILHTVLEIIFKTVIFFFKLKIVFSMYFQIKNLKVNLTLIYIHLHPFTISLSLTAPVDLNGFTTRKVLYMEHPKFGKQG